MKKITQRQSQSASHDCLTASCEDGMGRETICIVGFLGFATVKKVFGTIELSTRKICIVLWGPG